MSNTDQTKPKFDPNQSYQAADDIDSGAPTQKPAFNPAQPYQAAPEEETHSAGDAALRGAAQGMTFGGADEFTAGALGALDYLKQGGKLDYKDYYKIRRDLIRKQDEEAKAEHPAAYTAGDVAGSVATTALPGLGMLNAGKGAGITASLAKGAAAGGLSGAGRSEAEDAAGTLKDALKGAAIGGALGGGLAAAPGATRALSTGIQKANTAAEKIGISGGLSNTVLGATLGHIFGHAELGAITGGVAGPVARKLGDAAITKLREAGPSAEKYLTQFQDAIQRGAQGALHQELLQSDPEYRALVSQ